jgi:Ca-activated chloride channel homolog
MSAMTMLSSGLTAMAQEGEFRVGAHAELVLLDVSVKDKAGGFVSNLKEENFRIFGSGTVQMISRCAREDLPVNGRRLVTADSGSMRSRRAQVITAGLAFVQARNRDDEIFVTRFNDCVRSGLPVDARFSDGVEKLREAMMNSSTEGRTAYDAIVFSLKRLESGKQDKKTLVLMSDGGDNASPTQYKDAGAGIASDHLHTEYSTKRSGPESGAPAPFGIDHGGEALFLSNRPEVVDICGQIAKDIRNRYTIGYVPYTGQ